MASTSSDSFSVAEARAIVQDLLKPKAAIYWADFLVTITIAFGAAGIYLTSPLFSPQQIICFFIAGFGLHRLSNYIHEIAHLNSKRYLGSFQIAWNIMAGVPMLTPSFFFENHMAHHNGNHYGTRSDCEYVALGRKPLRSVFLFLMQVPLQPIYTVFRFTIVTPISFLHPKIRNWVLRNYSSFVFILPCPRDVPENAPRKWWATMDILCSMRAWAIFVFVLAGWNPWYRIPQLYLLAMFPLALHYFRSMTAHNYMSEGKKVSFDEQLADSIDIKGNFLTELLYPIGLRYHALHHLFPSMPFHNLGKAHRRLMAELPEDSLYREVVYPSVWSVLRELLRHARQSSRSSKPTAVVEPSRQQVA